MVLAACMNKLKQFTAIGHIFKCLFLRPLWLTFIMGIQKQITLYFMTQTAIDKQQGAFGLCGNQLFCVKSTIHITA